MHITEFVGPDGKIYSEQKPEEGRFLTYFDGSRWLIAFPISNCLDQNYCFFGDHLPVKAQEWRILHFGKKQLFPVFAESEDDTRNRIRQDVPLECAS